MALICETRGGRANLMRSPFLRGAHVLHWCVARPDNRRLRCGDLRAAPVYDALVNGPTRNRTENLLIKSQLLCQLSYRPSRAAGGAAENSSGPGGEARERVGNPILVPHSSVSLNVSLIGKRSTQSRRAKSLSDQMTV